MRSHYHSAFTTTTESDAQNVITDLGLRYEADQQAAAYNVNMVNFWPDRYRGIDGTIESTGIVQANVNGIPASTIRGDWNNLQPRVGVAWRITNDWVVRAGAGLYFDLRTGQVAQSMFGNPPVYTRMTPTASEIFYAHSISPDN
jgi:outer membrane receptor protein involved in Fe transport